MRSIYHSLLCACRHEAVQPREKPAGAEQSPVKGLLLSLSCKSSGVSSDHSFVYAEGNIAIYLDED